MARFIPVLAASVSTVLLAGCVKDHKVEDELNPLPGLVQTGGDGGAELTAAAACDQLTKALVAARDRLGCSSPADDTLVCPGYVAVAGSLPCDAYVESSVKSCVDRVAAYSACSDFSVHACIATVVRASCHAPVLPEAGAPETGVRDGGSPEAGSDATGPADAGQPDASADSGPATPVDSGRD